MKMISQMVIETAGIEPQSLHTEIVVRREPEWV